MVEHFNGQFLYKGKFYTWKFYVDGSVKITDASFGVLRSFQLPLQLLGDKDALIEKCKEQLDKDTPKTSVDYTAYSDTSNDIFEP